jgi:hypothetical protein
VIGQRFTVAKRRVAMFCVALCMGLSAQMTIVVLDRAKHTFQIDHAPNGLAGAVFDHGHHLDVDVQHSPDRGHEDDHHVAVVNGHDDHDVQRVAGHGHPHDDDAAPPPGHHAHGDDAAPVHSHVHAHNDAAAGSTHHTHDGLPQGHDHGPITHHHHGSGMLTPWLVSAPPQIAVPPTWIAFMDYGVTGHPDAPAWRRDRPPKLNLERIA